jgi:hypothetical protein
MTDHPKPAPIPGAPGLVFRKMKDGWKANWQCRTDIAKRGYKPTTAPLWHGTAPSEADLLNIIAQCEMAQAEMLRWANDVEIAAPIEFDGTVRTLIQCYRTDPDSNYRKLRYGTRTYYSSLCRRIEADLGDKQIEDIDARMMLRTHEAWAKSGIPMAHSLVGMLRTLVTFGATLLKSKDCRALKVDLHDMKFKMGPPRSERLTSEQAIAIRVEARARKLPSIALAQAIQFECMLRQRDVIGEWIPISEPGLSHVTYDGDKWMRGILWSEIDTNLILRHVTSKRQKLVEHDLSVAGMVMEEFALMGPLPTTGPVVVCEITKRPWRGHHFRQKWREIARAVGIPDSVRSMDSRAGAITEATEAGADLEHIKHAAAHSDIAMTQKYSRGAADKTRGVALARAAHRKNKSGT